MKITSDDILALIEDRHIKDVFIVECKNGESWGSNLLRLDAWAMKKSWAHPCTYGYEIKVSRSDWLKDEKWIGYKKYCNEIYLVCPPGVIQPEELAEDTGLLYISSTGSRLYIKKKAQHREVQIPEEFYRYILMNRVKIVSSTMYNSHVSKEDFWRKWMVSKKENEDFGHIVGKKLSEVIKKQIYEREVENHRLQKEIETYRDLKEKIQVLGVGDSWYTSLADKFQDRLKRISEIFPESLVREIDDLNRNLIDFQEKIKKWRKGETLR